MLTHQSAILDVYEAAYHSFDMHPDPKTDVTKGAYEGL
jgi:hypothetical protein